MKLQVSLSLAALAAGLVLARPQELRFSPWYAAAATLAATLFWGFLETSFLRPWLLVRRLRAQGVSGYPFRPVVGNLPELVGVEVARAKDPELAAATRASQFHFDGTKSFGKFWTWSMGSAPRVVLADPGLVRSAMLTNSQDFAKPKEVRMLSLLANGLASVEGAAWARQRRLLTPAFHFAQLRDMLPLMAKCSAEAIREWDAQALGSAGSAELEMDKELCNLTLKIIVTTAFGACLGADQGQEKALLSRIQEGFNDYNSTAQQLILMTVMLPVYPWLPTASNRKMWRSEAFLRETLMSLIAERVRKSGDAAGAGKDGESNTRRVDLLQLMLDARDEEHGSSGKSKGESMSEQQIMAECLTFFFAGHETTARLLSWTMAMLSQHPEWQEKAREEVMQLKGGRGEDWAPEFDELGQFKVVTWVLQETLRMFPPASMVVRVATKDVKLSGDLFVPEGCTIVVPIEVIHHSVEFWGSDAAMFNPGRFADGASKAASHPGAFIPFGLGARVCIGQNFAMLEARLILTLILSRFSWTTTEKYQHYPASVLTIQPKHGLPLVLTKL